MAVVVVVEKDSTQPPTTVKKLKIFFTVVDRWNGLHDPLLPWFDHSPFAAGRASHLGAVYHKAHLG